MVTVRGKSGYGTGKKWLRYKLSKMPEKPITIGVSAIGQKSYKLYKPYKLYKVMAEAACFTAAA